MVRPLYDVAALLARLGVGGIFVAHGWRKLQEGLAETARQFAAMDAPAPSLWAGTTMFLELIGGLALIAGLGVRIVGVLLAAEAAAVFALGDSSSALPLAGGSAELVVALGAAAVLFLVTGAGRVSLDHLIGHRREAAGEEDSWPAWPPEERRTEPRGDIEEPDVDPGSVSSSGGAGDDGTDDDRPTYPRPGKRPRDENPVTKPRKADNPPESHHERHTTRES